jgi:hypothetical protein
MSHSHKPPGHKKGASPKESAAVRVFKAMEPMVDKGTEKSRLDTMRILLSRSAVVECRDPAPLVYEDIVMNISRNVSLRTTDGNLHILLTRAASTVKDWAEDAIFLLSKDNPARNILLTLPPFEMDLRRRYVLWASVNPAREMELNMCRVFEKDYEKLGLLAGLVSSAEAKSRDTLEPRLNSGRYKALNIDDFREKLMQCEPNGRFNIRAFAKSIRFVTTMYDSDNREHYLIVAGRNESFYRLYVNAKAEMPEGCLKTVVLRYNKEECTLYKLPK